MELVGHTIDVIGKVLVAFTAISVHTRFWREHKIDEEVFTAMKKERTLGIVGIALIIIGFFLQLPSII